MLPRSRSDTAKRAQVRFAGYGGSAYVLKASATVSKVMYVQRERGGRQTADDGYWIHARTYTIAYARAQCRWRR